jgi:hypothetical protein
LSFERKGGQNMTKQKNEVGLYWDEVGKQDIPSDSTYVRRWVLESDPPEMLSSVSWIKKERTLGDVIERKEDGAFAGAVQTPEGHYAYCARTQEEVINCLSELFITHLQESLSQA